MNLEQRIEANTASDYTIGLKSSAVLDRRRIQRGLLADRIVPPQLLDWQTVAARARVDGDDAIKRFLLATHASESNLYRVVIAQTRQSPVHTPVHSSFSTLLRVFRV